MQDVSVTSGFEVSVDKLRALGIENPYSVRSLEAYASGQLSSDERLYFAVWGSHQTRSTAYAPRTAIATRGEEVRQAIFVVRGRIIGSDGSQVYRLGPGAVLGLAEALADLPHQLSAVTVGAVEARLLPIHAVQAALPAMHAGLRGLLRAAVMRTLALEHAPEGLR